MNRYECEQHTRFAGIVLFSQEKRTIFVECVERHRKEGKERVF
jgi:hypothetical protein